MSWTGKILRVNLTTGSIKVEPTNMDWARAYIGSRGLGTKYLVEEVNAKVDPLSADNKIIWATGPLTGTMASTGGRYTVICRCFALRRTAWANPGPFRRRAGSPQDVRPSCAGLGSDRACLESNLVRKLASWAHGRLDGALSATRRVSV